MMWADLIDPFLSEALWERAAKRDGLGDCESVKIGHYVLAAGAWCIVSRFHVDLLRFTVFYETRQKGLAGRVAKLGMPKQNLKNWQQLVEVGPCCTGGYRFDGQDIVPCEQLTDRLLVYG